MVILHLRFHRVSREAYGQVFTALADISPTVQALPPDAALVDITGALSYFGRSPVELADLIQTRLLARYGLQSTVGGGPNPMLATMAARACSVGGVQILPDKPDAVTDFLAGLPVQVLPGVGPALTRAFTSYGLTCVGDLQALPMTTLQRIAGATVGRRLHERALGIDRRRIQSGGPPASLSATHEFDRDTLDPAIVRRTLLALAVDLGDRLRASEQAARTVELQLRYADRSTTTRTRTLREASNHTPAIQDALYKIFASLGLQRARLRTLTAYADRLIAADRAPAQLSFDRPTEHARLLEPAIDRANARFGPGTLRPASLAHGPTALCNPVCTAASMSLASSVPSASAQGATSRWPCTSASPWPGQVQGDGPDAGLGEHASAVCPLPGAAALSGWQAGADPGELRRLSPYWASGYDWGLPRGVRPFPSCGGLGTRPWRCRDTARRPTTLRAPARRRGCRMDQAPGVRVTSGAAPLSDWARSGQGAP